eukprot:scaffold314411_cov47-Attheya_sp.AAC.1
MRADIINLSRPVLENTGARVEKGSRGYTTSLVEIMSTSMEVDTPTTAGGDQSGSSQQQEKILKVHPLALINISDHCTRVRAGGSALASTSPVLGILFGYQEGLVVTIVDAEEIEYTHSSTPGTQFGGGTEEEQVAHKQSIQTKIVLHQKVFTRHEVVGWYRVSDEEHATPTEEDLRMNTGVMRDFNESPIFVLMSDTNTASNNTSNHSSRTTAKLASSEGQEAREQLERDERLPLSIYETLVTISGEENTARAVFVNMEFELETYGPERIAVETVFKSRPGSNKSKPSSKEKQAANQESMDNISLEESGLDRQMESVTTSISSMNARVAILLDFLTKTRNGDIPPNHALLRQVDGLVRQLPAKLTKSSEFTNEYQDMMTLSYLAAVAQTTRIVQGYTEKFDLIHNPDVGALGGGTSSSRMDML